MSSKFYIPQDAGLREIILDNGKAHARTVGGPPDAIMRRNQELRKNDGAVKTTSFGKLELDIPLSHMPMLNKFFPELSNPSHPDHKFALRAFMKSPASAPYRLQEHKKGVNRRI